MMATHDAQLAVPQPRSGCARSAPEHSAGLARNRIRTCRGPALWPFSGGLRPRLRRREPPGAFGALLLREILSRREDFTE